MKNQIVLASIWIFLFLMTNINAQEQFVPHLIFGEDPAVYKPSSLFTGDLDNDNDLDVISSSNKKGEIVWFENDGTGHFTYHLLGQVDKLGQIQVVDFNQDSSLDIAYASLSLNEFGLFQNDGVGSFTQHALVQDVEEYADFEIADLDSDGDMDICYIPSEWTNMNWYRNEGSGNFSKQVIDEEFVNYSSIDVVDMDRDGDMDLLLGQPYFPSIFLYENDGTQQFTPKNIDYVTDPYADWFNNPEICAIDFDGDGDLDIFEAYQSYYAPGWYQNDGNQNFTYSTFGLTACESCFLEYLEGAIATDLDKDGDADIVNGEFGNISIYENSGEMTFSESTLELNSSKLLLCTGDLDGDYGIDIIAADVDNCEISWFRNGYSWDKYGQIMHFSPKYKTVIAKGLLGANSVFSADMDNDGDMDVVSTAEPVNSIYLHTNDGLGNFTSDTIFTTIQGLQDARSADLDNDGDMDIILNDRNNLLWQESTTEGFILQNSIIKYNNNIRSFLTADLDFDGDLDLVTTGDDRDNDKLIVHENTGSGQFIDHMIFPNNRPLISLLITDMDQDGKQDILTSHYTGPSSEITWHRNLGDLSFCSHLLTSEAQYPFHLSAADLNGDGRIDIVSNWYESKLVWYGRDDYENYLEHTIAEKAYLNSIVTEDMDLDGDIDILTVSEEKSVIGWYENDGKGNFTPYVITTEADGACDICATDIDGDGDPDVVSASNQDRKVRWYCNVMQPVANFKADTLLGEVPLTVQFYDSSSGVRTSWLWNFGDGETSTERNPIHTYTEQDSFTVTLSLNGPNGSCMDKKDNYIITLEPSAVTNDMNNLPQKYQLYDNYPNPFNPTTHIQFDLPQTSRVEICVYDIQGKIVDQLLNEKYPAGQHEVQWNAANHPSGIYFIRMTSDKFTETRKCLLLK